MISQSEAAKNATIQNRFDTKAAGTRSRCYLVQLKDGTKANVIFNDGEGLEEATECMRQHYGDRLLSVSSIIA